MLGCPLKHQKKKNTNTPRWSNSISISRWCQRFTTVSYHLVAFIPQVGGNLSAASVVLEEKHDMKRERYGKLGRPLVGNLSGKGKRVPQS